MTTPMNPAEITTKDQMMEVLRPEDLPTCGNCGHPIMVDMEESHAADVPDDEVFIRCTMGDSGNCTARFADIHELI